MVLFVKQPLSDAEIVRDVCERVATDKETNVTQPFDYIIGDRGELATCTFQGSKTFTFDIGAVRALQRETED